VSTPSHDAQYTRRLGILMESEDASSSLMNPKTHWNASNEELDVRVLPEHGKKTAISPGCRFVSGSSMKTLAGLPSCRINIERIMRSC